MRVALLEIDSSETIPLSTRINQSNNLISRALDFKSDLIVLPELWFGSAHNVEKMLDFDASIWDSYLKELRKICLGKCVYIHSGSVALNQEGLRNRAHFIDSAGDLFFYDKRKLFGFGAGESSIFVNGQNDLIVNLLGINAALFTCYDLRFPELFRSSLRKGMDLAVVSAAWPKARLHHWSRLLCARAIENQIFVIGCNGVGIQGEVEMCGHSEIYGPDGAQIALEEVYPSLFIAEIDITEVFRSRVEFPVLGDI